MRRRARVARTPVGACSRCSPARRWLGSARSGCGGAARARAATAAGGSPPPGVRYGKVFVARRGGARARSTSCSCPASPRTFPRKIGEEPILLDAVRAARRGLATNDRVSGGAARAAPRGQGNARARRAVPRLDVDGSRPRVPSFYTSGAARGRRRAAGLRRALAARGDVEPRAARLAGARRSPRRDRRGRVRPRAARRTRGRRRSGPRHRALSARRESPPRARAALPRAPLGGRRLDAGRRPGAAERRRPARARRTRAGRAQLFADGAAALRALPVQVLPVRGVEARAARGARGDRGARPAPARLARARGAVRAVRCAARRGSCP